MNMDMNVNAMCETDSDKNVNALLESSFAQLTRRYVTSRTPPVRIL
jgi:hypothetical protein